MNNKKIDQFLKNTFRTNHDLGEILAELKELAEFIEPDSNQGIKYGGLCFFLGERMRDATLCTGFFVYTKHLSVEFGNGSHFDDKYNQLEGKGKYRRHIKLTGVDDIDQKHMKYYLKQAFTKLKD